MSDTPKFKHKVKLQHVLLRNPVKIQFEAWLLVERLPDGKWVQMFGPMRQPKMVVIGYGGEVTRRGGM